MRYFKAFELADAPFITWQLWANSIEELAEMEDFEDPLIVGEDSLPVKLFGVYVEKIVDGALVARTEEEMTDFDDSSKIKKALTEDRLKIEQFDAESFGFSDHLYPMHESARLRYMAVAMDGTLGSAKFLTTLGIAIDINVDDFPAFFNAYYKKIQSITNL